MRCVSCKSENLMGNVKADIMLPLAQKGGNVVTAGYTVTQKMVEKWWLEADGKERTMLGPIFCADCGAEHTYFKGMVPALRAVPYEDAVQNGYDHYAATPAPKASADKE